MSKGVVTEETRDRLRLMELEDLDQSLPEVYLALASAYAEAGGELNNYIIDVYLPSKIFEVAKQTGWVSNPSYRISNTLSKDAEFCPEEGGWRDKNNSSIGKWLVNTKFREAFYERLSPAILAVRKIAEANAGPNPRWVTPTPAEIVKTFLDEERWKKARLIEKIAEPKEGKQAPLNETAKKQLKLVITEPVTPNFLKDYHVLLCHVIRDNSETYRNLQPLDLVWRYQR
jgi:hypothetical protein